MGEIYMIKSPSDKIYIGQTIYNFENRWRDHIYDAFDPKKDHCKILNRAIRKYGKDNFYVTLIKKCDIDNLDENEIFYIKVFNSLKPLGYNIKEGGKSGRHSEETKLKIKNSLKGVPKSLEMRQKLSKSRNKAGLPMYLLKIKNGYRISNHPKQNGRERKITTLQLSDEEKLKIALEYLNKLNDL